MSDRKVLNFYIPPDFDPSKVPKGVRHKRIEVTMMLPFSIQCTTCGEFMSKGKKFNAKVEEIPGADYLGVKVWRFIGKCVSCNAPYSFKTDPKNMDFAVEAGCSRNFEAWRSNIVEQEAAKLQKEEEEKLDAMKALENRTLDSKRQMEIIDALEEMRALRSRQAKLLADPDALLAAVFQVRLREDEEGEGEEGTTGTGIASSGGGVGASSAGLTEVAEDDELISRIFAAHRRGGSNGIAAAGASVASQPEAVPSHSTHSTSDGRLSSVSSESFNLQSTAAVGSAATVSTSTITKRLISMDTIHETNNGSTADSVSGHAGISLLDPSAVAALGITRAIAAPRLGSYKPPPPTALASSGGSSSSGSGGGVSRSANVRVRARPLPVAASGEGCGTAAAGTSSDGVADDGSTGTTAGTAAKRARMEGNSSVNDNGAAKAATPTVSTTTPALSLVNYDDNSDSST